MPSSSEWRPGRKSEPLVESVRCAAMDREYEVRVFCTVKGIHQGAGRWQDLTNRPEQSANRDLGEERSAKEQGSTAGDRR